MPTAQANVEPSKAPQRFAMTPESIVYDTSLAGTTRLVYTAVALSADQETRHCFFNQGKLAAKLGMSRSTLNRHLQHLQDAGHLQIEAKTAADRDRGGGNARVHSDYWLLTRASGRGGRFAIVPESIIFDASLKMARLAYIAVALHAHKTTGHCFFNQGKLAEKLGMSRGTLNLHLGLLRDAGHLRIEAKTAAGPGGGGGNARIRSDYWLLTRAGDAARHLRAAAHRVADEVASQDFTLRKRLVGRGYAATVTVAEKALAEGISERRAADELTESIEGNYGMVPCAADLIELASA